MLKRAVKKARRILLAKRNEKLEKLRAEILETISIDNLIGSGALRHSTEPRADEAPNSFCCYTTFCGPKKALSLKADVSGIDGRFYFISNNDDCLSFAEKRGWVPCLLDTPVVPDSVLSASQAKIAKAMPHLFPFLAAHDYTFYFDDKKNLAPAQAASAFAKFTEDSDFSLKVARHPFLSNSVLAELAEAMGQGRYFSQRQEAVSFILSKMAEGDAVRDIDLFWTAYIFRNMNHPDTSAANSEWYRSINACGIECQISFDFVAQHYKSIKPFDLEDYLHE